MTLAFVPRPNDRKLWDAQDVETLLELLAFATPIPLVAKALGRSQEAVRRKATTLGRMGGSRRPR